MVVQNFAAQPQLYNYAGNHAGHRPQYSPPFADCPPPPPPPTNAMLGYAPSFTSTQRYTSTDSSSSGSRLPLPHRAPPPTPPTPRKRDPPPETRIKAAFRCAPCQLTLATAAALVAHTSTHITCDACPFTAAPKVVRGHFAAAHGKFAGAGYRTVTVALPGARTVQRFRICVGNQPEDIQRWIAERRQRFPRQTPPPPPPAAAPSPPSAATAKDNCNDNATRPTGLSSLLAGYGSSSSDDDETCRSAENRQQLLQQQQHNNNAAGVAPTVDEGAVAIAAAVDVDAPGAVPPRNYRTRPCRFFARHGNCRNGDACNYSHDESSRSSLGPRRGGDGDLGGPMVANNKRPRVGDSATATPQRRSSISNDNKNTAAAPAPPPSLLQKLLANDVKRETILTLQLLDFIAASNFFGPVLQQQPPPDVE